MATDLVFRSIWIAGQLALTSVISVVLYCLYKAITIVYDGLTTPLRDLPGPPSKSLLYGNFKEIWQNDTTALQEKWVEEHGPTIIYAGLLRIPRLYTLDHKALNHILSNNYDYQKPESATYGIRRILGEGVLLVEGDVHKKQRKVLNPAFGPQQIRELTEIFVDKSILLRDIWAEEIKKQNEDGGAKIEVLSWLSRTALDVIGRAGFNYEFDALVGGQNELNEAFKIMFRTGVRFTPIPVLRGLIPALRFLPAPGDASSKKASNTLFRIGSQLLAESKAAITEDDKKSFEGRDILSILVRANAMPDLPESQRLSDKDVLAQIPTFMVAGHETTGVAVTWTLFALTQDKDVQNKLRAELERVSTDNPTMDDLNSLPYLDAVVRETLRLHAPVPSTLRVAMKDDIIPLEKPYTDRKGNMHYEIRVTKGQTVIIPITPLNRDKSVWGEDAHEFRPGRWQNLPEAVSTIPGVWGNMLTFLGGPKACIGYRFSIVEMKAIIFTLVRAFEFDLAVSASRIVKKAAVVQRPILVTEGAENSNQLPLLVRPVVSQ